MTQTPSQPTPYSSFDVIEDDQPVHLRIVGHSAVIEPRYRDALRMSVPVGVEGRKSASFFVPSLGPAGEIVPNVSEVQFVAWTL